MADLHLGAKTHADPAAVEQQVCRWLRSIAPTAKRLYLLGDILDYWYEYKYVVPRGFIRFFGTLAELADSGVEITWLIGNHDIWIFDYLPHEIGFRLVRDQLEETIDGKRFFMAHGDGLGRVPMAERIMRTAFRSPLLQWLFAGVHPRWTVGLAYGWSASNRGKHHPADSIPKPEQEVKILRRWIQERQASLQPAQRPDYYIFGHFHLPMEMHIEGSEVLLLGDWFRHPDCAVFDGKSLHREKISSI